MITDPKQIERLYKQSYLAYIATIAGAILAYWLFLDIADSKILNVWFIVFILFALSRFLITWKFNKRNKNKDIEIWFIVFLITSAISGTMWGLTGFLFIPKGSLPLLDAVLYQGILLLFIAALLAGSAITYSASKIVYLSFSVPAVVPQCLMLIAKGDKYHSFLGGVILAYALVMLIVSIYIHRVFSEYCKAETENELLKATLKANGIELDTK